MYGKILRTLTILMMAMTVSVSTAQFHREEWDNDLTHSLQSCYTDEVEGLTDAYHFFQWVVNTTLHEYMEWMNETEGDINDLTVGKYLDDRYFLEKIGQEIPPCFEAYRLYYTAQRLMADYLLTFFLAHHDYDLIASAMISIWKRSLYIITEDQPLTGFTLFDLETQR